jgi:hypothetical protein
MSNTTFATVTEAQADEATAAIFADIRDTMGIALVNLIWRHLAVSPEALSWSWRSVKPLYSSGAVPQAAWALRQTLALPELNAFSEQERRAIVDIDGELSLVDAVLRTYERGNAQNLVALCALRVALTSTVNDDPDRIRKHAAAKPKTVNAVGAASADHADRITEALPPLPAMADLSAKIRVDIESLAEVWVPAQHRGMIPSVFRHLAHWPRLLAIYRNKLHTLAGTPQSVAELAVQAINEATCHATPLVAQLDPPAALNLHTQHWLGGALDLFIDGMIGGGVVIVPAMRKVLPAPTH